MKSRDADERVEPPHPREAMDFFGHADAERILLEAYASGRIPHAWLIGGPPGIGKATLAYRMARFVFAHPDPSAPEVQSARSLAVDSGHPAARRIAVLSHPDLLALERTIGERGKLRQDIAVDDIRRSGSFFGSTAGEGGWRIAIVDSVDDLNPSGANALLKLIEEPPPRALLLLVSNAAGRVLPTIRSRCRVLTLRPLAVADVARAAASALGRDVNDRAIQQAAIAAEGSVSRALRLLEGPTLELRDRILELLQRLPNVDARALHGLGDAIGGTAPEPLEAFVDAVNSWLSSQLDRAPQESRRMALVAEVWGKVNRAAEEAETYNLERKPLVFTIFGLLAEAARG